jgi:hypothetical protein
MRILYSKLKFMEKKKKEKNNFKKNILLYIKELKLL